MRINPNSPLWSIYLYLLIHGGDPAPDDDNPIPIGPHHIFEKVLTAGILVQVASTIKEPQVKAILQNEAMRQFENSFNKEGLETESYR